MASSGSGRRTLPPTESAFPVDTHGSPRLAEYKAVRGFERAFVLHFHPEWSVALVRRGTSRARIGSVWYDVAAGDVVLIPPYLPHVCNPDRRGHWSYDLLLVDDGSFAVAAGGRPAEAGVVVSRACETCRALFRRALILRDARPLLEHVPLHAELSHRGRPTRLRPDIAAIASRLAAELERSPCLEELSRPLGMDPSSFIRAFKREYGITPHAWVLSLRISRAKALLRAGLPLVDAALEAGFTDQSHLSRHFVRLVGITPAAWVRECDNFVQDSPG